MEILCRKAKRKEEEEEEGIKRREIYFDNPERNVDKISAQLLLLLLLYVHKISHFAMKETKYAHSTQYSHLTMRTVH